MSPTNPFGDPNLVNAKYATIGHPGDDPNRWFKFCINTISGKCEAYILFGFTVYLMHLADYLKRK